MFDDNIRIELWGYNIETVLAEKIETILRRGLFNTSPRDFYDMYILGTTQDFDKDIFKNAIKATAEHRGSAEHIADVEEILKQIAESSELKDMWRKYQNKFAYAKDITFGSVMEIVQMIAKYK